MASGTDRRRMKEIEDIKEKLRKKLMEEMGKPYQDQSYCDGLYYALRICEECDVSEVKEHKNE